MSLPRRVYSSKCRGCLLCLRRNYNSEANADDRVNRKLALHWKTMSVNNWRLIAQIKDQFTDTTIMHVVKREWVDLVKRIPSASGQITSNQSQDVTTKPPADSSRVGQVLLESFQVLNGLKAKLSQSSTPSTSPAMSDTKWKRKVRNISTESIISRTKYVISSLETAKSDESIVQRLDDLMKHLLDYPDAAGLAVKHGAIRVLLRVRSKRKEADSVSEGAQAALSMIGYADPPAGRGIRILAIDGGGVRGLLVIEMLRRLEELTDKKIHELFDFICGVSTGSILASTIGAKGKSLDEIAQLYKDLSTKIFTQNAFEGARSLLWSHGYYDTAQWEKILQDNVGQTTFHESARKRWCPKIAAVSTVVSEGVIVPFVFRNYEHPYRVRSQYIGSNRFKLWEATRASAAAPAIFGGFRLGNYLHQDGGMLVNNPTAVALHEAKLLWPRHAIQCVVSCGTGRVNPTSSNPGKDDDQLIKTSSWKETFSQVLVSATDTEAVHTILSDLLPSTRYFRFNPYLTEMLSMVEFQPEKLALLEQDAAMYIRRNDEKFAEAAEALAAPKPIYNQCRDWLAHQTAMYHPF